MPDRPLIWHGIKPVGRRSPWSDLNRVNEKNVEIYLATCLQAQTYDLVLSIRVKVQFDDGIVDQRKKVFLSLVIVVGLW